MTGTTKPETSADAFARAHVRFCERAQRDYPYSLPAAALAFDTLADLRAAVTASGSHFFDRDTLRAWHCTVTRTFHGRRFFVTHDSIDSGQTFAYRVAYVYAVPARPRYRYLGSTAPLPPATACLQVERLTPDCATLADARELARAAARACPYRGIDA